VETSLATPIGSTLGSSKTFFSHGLDENLAAQLTLAAAQCGGPLGMVCVVGIELPDIWSLWLYSLVMDFNVILW